MIICVQTANASVYSNMLLCLNKLSMILLISVSSLMLCDISSYPSCFLLLMIYCSWYTLNMFVSHMNTINSAQRQVHGNLRTVCFYICLLFLCEWSITFFFIPFCQYTFIFIVKSTGTMHSRCVAPEKALSKCASAVSGRRLTLAHNSDYKNSNS